MRKVLVNPLAAGQMSLTEIPKLLYAQFLKSFAVGEETLFVGDDSAIVRFVPLKVPASDPSERVFALYVESPSGEAVSTDFALNSYIPHDHSELLRTFFPNFEVGAYPASCGWSLGEGRSFEEILSFRTEANNKLLTVANPVTEYVYLALAEAYRLARESRFMSRKFIDHAPSSRC